jgi:hypothetical protein
MEGTSSFFNTDLNISIPLLIDDVKNYHNFKMARCTYFSIQCDVPSPNWQLGLGRLVVPFFLVGLSGIIFKPLGNRVIFSSHQLIEDLFNVIEEHPSFFIDTNDIWMPNNIFFNSPMRGQVYRVDYKLFMEAYLFREEKISKDKFIGLCEEMKGNIRYSEEETVSFKHWGELQIKEAKHLYPKNIELELKYRGMHTRRRKHG